jgi:hypothetical protein
MLIDHRVGAVELTKYVKTKHEVTKLEFADVCLLGNGPDGMVSVGIERKRLRDLLDSINSGRLSGHQLIGLTNAYNYIYILVEGIFKIGKDGYIRRPKGRGWVVCQFGNGDPIKYQYVTNYLNTLSIFARTIIHFTPSILASGLWLDGLYSWWTKPWKDHKSHMQFYSERPPARAFFKTPKLVVRMVKEIEGVGWDRAKAIGRVYPDVMSLAFSSVEDLVKIPGIGKKTAVKILQSIRGAA